jgi:cysteine-S-conjugate beta-lyase
MSDGLLISPTDDELRRRSGLKWSRTEPGAIAADIAELDFDVAAPISQVLHYSVAHSDFGYPDFTSGTPLRLKHVYSERTATRFGWRPDPDRVELCAQVAQALCCALMAFTEPGDVVVTHAPTYGPIQHAIELLGRRCVTIPVTDLVDATELEDALRARSVQDRVRMMVLCQPHNPTGHVFDATTLGALGSFAERHDVVVFSDEIHQDLVHSPGRSHSPAATRRLAGRTVAFTSAAKSFNIPGLRCAVGHFGSPGLHAAFTRLPWHLRDGASLPGIAATLAAWESGDEWLGSLRRQLLRNRSILIDRLRELECIHWRPPEATYLAWLDLSGSAAAASPRDFFADKANVHLQPGSAFGDDFGAFARLNFGTSEARLCAILERLASALKS